MEQRSPDKTEKIVNYFSQKRLPSSIKQNRRQATGGEETIR